MGVPFGLSLRPGPQPPATGPRVPEVGMNSLSLNIVRQLHMLLPMKFGVPKERVAEMEKKLRGSLPTLNLAKVHAQSGSLRKVLA